MLAIIPARGGSKGLPNKNIKLLNGKPLITYTIEAALNAHLVDRVICSTDNEYIGEKAEECGAEWLQRPSELATDDSPVIDTYLHTIESICENPTEFIALLPTSPLRTSEDIDKAITLFYQKQADSVISVCRAKPISWCKMVDVDGVLRGVINDGNNLLNRQQEGNIYLPNGAIYVFRYDILKTKRVYYTSKTYPYFMPPERSVDIDTLEDFEYAEYLLKKQEWKS